MNQCTALMLNRVSFCIGTGISYTCGIKLQLCEVKMKVYERENTQHPFVLTQRLPRCQAPQVPPSTWGLSLPKVSRRNKTSRRMRLRPGLLLSALRARAPDEK